MIEPDLKNFIEAATPGLPIQHSLDEFIKREFIKKDISRRISSLNILMPLHDRFLNTKNPAYQELLQNGYIHRVPTVDALLDKDGKYDVRAHHLMAGSPEAISKIKDFFGTHTLEAVATRNFAMNTANTSKKYGGIDLTPANMNLLVRNAGRGIKFHVSSAMLQQLQNVPGFTPVIINIQPLNSLQQFLGVSETKELSVNG